MKVTVMCRINKEESKDLVWLSQWKEQTQRRQEQHSLRTLQQELPDFVVTWRKPLHPLLPPSWLTETQTQSCGRETERESKYLIGSPWFTNSYMEGGARDSPTRPPTMGGGSSPKAYSHAISKRKMQLAVHTLTTKCLESSGPKGGFWVHVSKRLSVSMKLHYSWEKVQGGDFTKQ